MTRSKYSKDGRQCTVRSSRSRMNGEGLMTLPGLPLPGDKPQKGERPDSGVGTGCA